MTSPAEQLLRVAEMIERPREEDGTDAALVALLPCEPAVGEVAVVCWSDSEGGELVELVRLADGARIDDRVALREALTLLAMVETLEELASFEALPELAAQLGAWDGHGMDMGPEFVDARDGALQALATLVGLAPSDEEPRIARPGVLDDIGAALRELERAWELLEQAAEQWSDAHLQAHPQQQPEALARVQGLWRLLGTARRGPLERPPSVALRAGREAGAAMAAAVGDAGASS